MSILTPPPKPNNPRPTRAQQSANIVVALAQSDFARAKTNYRRIHKMIWDGKAAPADVLKALGANAGSLVAYGQQLGAHLDAAMPGTTAAMPVTAKIKPVTVNADGTAALKS